MNIILLKLLTSLLLLVAAAGFWIKRDSLQKRFDGLNETIFLGVSWTVLRFIPFAIVYLVADYTPQSDVAGFWKEASGAAHGQVVYRDFWCPYSPLYPYFLAMWVNVWYNSKMLIIAMACMDGLALLLTNKFFQHTYTKGYRLWISLMYLVLPGSLMLCIIGGQEDIWMWAMLLCAFLLKQRFQSTAVYSFVLAIGLLLTKAIFVLVIIPMFLIEKNKWSYAWPMAIVGSVTLLVLYPLVGWEFLQPLDEAKVLRAPNILSVVNPLLADSIGVGQKFWNWLALVITMSIGIRVLFREKESTSQQMLSRFWVVVFATMMIAQQSAYSNYLFLFMMPLLFGVINWEDRKQVAVLFCYNLLCVVHPSWWWRLDMPNYDSVGMIFSKWQYTLDYGMQIAIVGLTIIIIKWAYTSPKKVV